MSEGPCHRSGHCKLEEANGDQLRLPGGLLGTQKFPSLMLLSSKRKGIETYLGNCPTL